MVSLVISIVFTIIATTSAHATIDYITQSEHSNQYSPITNSLFWHKPSYNQHSIRNFLEQTYNNAKYAKDFLTYEPSYHLEALLSFASQNPQPYEYIEKVVNLFNIKIKNTQYITGRGATRLVQVLLPLLQELFTNPKITKPIHNENLNLNKAQYGTPYSPLIFNQLSMSAVQNQMNNSEKDLVKDALYQLFNEDTFRALKQDPEKILEATAEKICSCFNKHTISEKRTPKALKSAQCAIKKLLDTVFDRIIWDPRDAIHAWQSCKDIAMNVQELACANIIPSTELIDDLYWTLIARFCYYLELSYEHFNEDFFKQLYIDLTTLDHPLWEMPESEDCLTSKKEHIKQAAISAEITNRAFKAGLITDMLPLR